MNFTAFKVEFLVQGLTKMVNPFFIEMGIQKFKV